MRYTVQHVAQVEAESYEEAAAKFLGIQPKLVEVCPEGADAWQEIAVPDDGIALALQEALLFMEAPPGSPRHWAVSRANLTKMLTTALEQRKREAA